MFSVKACLLCFRWNMRILIKNLRFYLGLLLGLLICFFLTEKTITLVGTFHTDLQIFEPFIWCFADGASILFASLALLLPLSQMPRLDAPASFLIFRSGRRSWVTGQVLTAVVLSTLYTLLLLLGTCIFTVGNVFFENRWSDTAAVMSFSPQQFDVALNVVRRTVKQTDPYSCVLAVILLMAQYMLFLSMASLFVSLLFGKQAGISAVIGISLFSWLLTPSRFEVWFGLDEQLRYIANLWAAWVSPLQHAAYTMHSFGYDRLPTFAQTHLLMGGINLLLILLCMRAAGRVQFSFQKGDHYA